MSAQSKPFEAGNMIRPGDFVEVSGDSLVEDGYSDGMLLWVINVQSFPCDEDDPYLQRIYSICHKVNSDFSMTTDIAAVIDPRNLRKVDDDKQKLYYSQIEAHYAQQPNLEDENDTV